MDKEKNVEVKDPELRKELIHIFDKLDEYKSEMISKAMELSRDLEAKYTYNIKKDLLELYDKMQYINYSMASLADLIYGEGAVTNAYGIVCNEQNNGLRQSKTIIQETTLFDNKEKSI